MQNRFSFLMKIFRNKRVILLQVNRDMLHVDIIKLHVNMHISCTAIIPSYKLHAANKNDFFVNINDLHDRFHTPYFFYSIKEILLLSFCSRFRMDSMFPVYVLQFRLIRGRIYQFCVHVLTSKSWVFFPS